MRTINEDFFDNVENEEIVNNDVELNEHEDLITEYDSFDESDIKDNPFCFTFVFRTYHMTEERPFVEVFCEFISDFIQRIMYVINNQKIL